MCKDDLQQIFCDSFITVAKEYWILKQKLAELYPYDIDGYCLGKEAFVKDLEQRAIEWYTKWQINLNSLGHMSEQTEQKNP